MDAKPAEAGLTNATLDREVVLSRVFDAPRELVFRAWTEREAFARWFGPKGFSVVMHEHDARVGGRVRFDMIGPDGTRWTNRIDYLEITAPERLIYDHSAASACARADSTAAKAAAITSGPAPGLVASADRICR